MKCLISKRVSLGVMLGAFLVIPTLCRAAVEVDVALSYSPDAASRQGGEDNIQVNLANAIAGANVVHARSGTGARLRIAGFYQSTNNPVNVDNGQVINDLVSSSAYKNVRDFGSSVGADLVSYYSHNTGNAGNGQQPGMYSAIAEQWGNFQVIAHELGHNFGCDHRDGHENPKTIMLHNYCGGGAQGWFSNPQVWLNGVQLLGGDSCLGGGPNGGDNSLVIANAAQGRADARTRVAFAPDLSDAILHWSFTNAPGAAPAGTTVTDSVSGTALATLQGSGAVFTNNALRLPGGASGSGAAYLQLPGGIISSLTNVTIEIWATPLSFQSWERVMDFNNGTANYLMLTAAGSTALTSQRFQSVVNGSTVTLDSGLATTAGVQHHYTITFTDGAGVHGSAGGRWQWYRDGDAVAFLDVSNHLADLQDVNNWLGRSAYSSNSFANCDYSEVRISSVAMPRGQILANYLLGPNYVPTATVTLTNTDVFGTTSFNAAGQWSNGSAPSGGNSYETFGFWLRTPATSSSYTFGGSSLRLSGGSLIWKGTSSSSITINNLTLNNGTVHHAGSGTFTLAGNLSIATNGGVINDVNGAATISANLSGPGPITFLGNAATLTGNNSAFAGPMFIGNGVAGTVSIDSPARLGSVPGTFNSDQLTFNRGTLQTTATMTLSNDNRGILLDVSGGTFNVASGTTLTLASTLSSPVVANATVGSLEKNGAGTLILSGPANTFNGILFVDSGSTSANDGALRIANNVVMAGAHSPIYINNYSLGSSTLQLDGTGGSITLTQSISLAGRNGTTPAMQNLAGTNSINGMALYAGGTNYMVQSDAGLLTFYGGAIQSGSSGSRTLTFQGNGDFGITSTVQDGSGTPLNFVKTGTGKLTMSSTNTYTGTTTISGGTLEGNGSIAGTVTVQSGGKISPGTSVGILTVSNVVLNAGSTTFMEISKSPLTNDQLRVTGTVAYGGTLAVTNLAGTLALGDSFLLFNAAGKAGSFAATNYPALDAGLAWNFNPVSGVLSVVSSTNMAPTISSVSNQTVNEDVATSALAFTVGDAETAAGSLTLSAASSNPALVPTNNIVFGGSASNRTVTVTPVLNQNGTTTITLAVSDGSRTATTSFLLTVNAVNDAPTITAIANQNGSKNTPLGPLAFTIGDVETAASALTLTVTSSDLGFVPLENIVLGGSNANRNAIITPATDLAGTTTISITVSDGSLTATNSFTFTVKAVATISKADNTVALNLTNSWVGNVVPDAAAIAIWDSTVTSANSVALGGNMSWGGIMVSNPAGPVTITAGNTLTLGALGVDMSDASENLTVSSGLTIGAVNQAWNVASGRTLIVPAAFTRTAGATLVVGGDTGTVACNRTLANSIVGPWAVMNSSGAAANNSSSGYTFATTSGGNIVAYTAATPQADTTGAWGGIPSGGSGTVNYDVSAGTSATTGLNRNINTLRYTGAGLAQTGNNTGLLLNVNGIMNSGSGTLTIASGTQFGIAPSSTTANELVLAAVTAPITVNAYVADNVNPGSVTVVGTNVVTLAGANTYSGATTVNGNLRIGEGSAIPSGTGKGNVTLNGAMDLNGFSQTINGFSGPGIVDNTSVTAVTLTVGSNNASGIFNGVIKNSGGTVTLVKTGTGALTLAGNNTFSGGVTVQNAAGTLNVNSPAALGSGTLNMNIAGATLNNTSGAALAVANPLTVSANFTFAGSSDLTFGSTVNLGSVSKTITTTAGTLTLAGIVGGGGSLTKAGAGTLALTAANTFTGPTTVNAGSLLVNGSTSTGTITIANSSTLRGNGVIGGAVTVQSGGTLSPGTSVGVLTVNSSVTLQAGSTTVMEINQASQTNDHLSVTGTLTYGGTLSVTNLNGTLVAGDSFQLFSAASTTNAFAAMNLPTLDAGLSWDFDPPTGILSVISSVPTDPISVVYSTSGNSLTLSWPADHTGWRLQTQTNSSATGLSTNWFDVAGSAATNAIVLPMDANNGSVFYRLVYP